MQSKLADRVGILSIIFVTVLVLILAMVIVTMVVLKRRRRPKTERPQPEGVDLLKHVYTIQVTLSSSSSSSSNFAKMSTFHLIASGQRQEWVFVESKRDLRATQCQLCRPVPGKKSVYKTVAISELGVQIFHTSKNLIQTQAASSSDSKGGLSSSFESGNKSSSSRAASSGNFLSLTFHNTQLRPYLPVSTHFFSSSRPVFTYSGHFWSLNAFLETPLQQFPLISPSAVP